MHAYAYLGILYFQTVHQLGKELAHSPLGYLNDIFRKVIFKLILTFDGWGISREIVIRWFKLDLPGSILVQVMAWCFQATSHYLSQYLPRSMSLYTVTRPQWVKCVDKTIPRKWLSVKKNRLVATLYRCRLLSWSSNLPSSFCSHWVFVFVNLCTDKKLCIAYEVNSFMIDGVSSLHETLYQYTASALGIRRLRNYIRGFNTIELNETG